MSNRFGDADTPTELITLAVGAGSTCWRGGTGNSEYDSTEASAIVDDAVARLIELGWA